MERTEVKFLKSIFLVCALLMMASTGFTQQGELVDRSFAGSSKAKTPQEARKEIQDEAAKAVSEEIIKDLIGEERFSKNRSVIQNKVIKNSAKYIPFSKPSQLQQKDEEFSMSVEMKVSLRDLKQILQDNALLSSTDDIPVALPVITIVDRVQGKSYRWWNPSEREDQAFLTKEGRVLEDGLRTAFSKSNFYVLKPIEASLGNRIPNDFKNDRVNADDAQFLSQYFSAPLLMDGVIQFQKSDKDRNFRIDVRLSVIQVSNGRAIADVSRRYETESGPFERVIDKKFREIIELASADLSSQVLEAWQRGSLGTSVLRITLRGKGAPAATEQVKERIRSQITQIKSIRERMVTADSVSFEVDTSASPEEITGRIEALDFEGKKLGKISENRDEIVLQWR
ncbi:hypothetical protein BDW_07200 [Bdellovibrio bacteriovorus W]|nr:hypothetical protein BDW_07200 [Bdellovibrio bacteriovorus W]